MSFENGKGYRLKELKCEFLSGFAFKSSDYTHDGIPVIKIGNIQNRTVDTALSVDHVPKELITDKTKKFLLQNKDVLIAMTGQGSVGRVGRLSLEGGKLAFLNQRVGKFICDEENLNEDYLFYILASKPYQELLFNNGSGSGQPNLSPETILNTKISWLGYSEQKRIGSLLRSLDDKIELNRQTNQTLEAIAQALFKEWFVDFNFPGATGEMQESQLGDIPKWWKVVKLSEVLEVKYGKDHKHLESGKIPVYGSGGIMRFANRSLYEDESILIPRKGTLSNLFYINKPFWSVDTMFYTKIKLAKGGKYLFHLLLSLNLASMNVGSAVPSLTTEILNNIPVLIPNDDVLSKYEKVISSLFDQTEQNIQANQTLAELRNSLLPKLMKGEILT